MHYLSSDEIEISYDNVKVSWCCWHFDSEFFTALEKHGLPPPELSYDKMMEDRKLNELKVNELTQ